MTHDNNPEAFINSFEHTMASASCPKDQWGLVVIPCFIGTAQQSVDTLPASDLADYQKVKAAIFQTLNLRC